jgi:uncharacterized membrane protein YedE/YeeE
LAVDYFDSLIYININIFILRCARSGHGGYMEAILNVWPWYVAGPLMGFFVPFLLIVGNKLLGISSSFQHICSIVLNTKKFAASGYNVSSNRWKFIFVIGITLGGLTAKLFLGAGDVTFLPQQYYTLKGLIFLFTGGFLVGFGTRYANGCTAGHSIAGISTFQLSGLIATISFFVGGLIYTHYLFLFFN